MAILWFMAFRSQCSTCADKRDPFIGRDLSVFVFMILRLGKEINILQFRTLNSPLTPMGRQNSIKCIVIFSFTSYSKERNYFLEMCTFENQ